MIIKDSATLKEYASLSGTFDFAPAKPTLKVVERTHILPILGKDLLQIIEDSVMAGTVPPDHIKDLIELVRMAIGPLFCYYYADKADVHLSAEGMRRIESSTNKTAFQEQRTKFKEINLGEGEAALENLITFLEENSTDFPEWVESKEFLIYRSLFIKTGEEFNEFYPSASPRRNFWAMRSTMRTIEELQIRKFLGADIYELLKTKDKLRDPGFTEEQAQLLTILKNAIANFCVAVAAPSLHVRLDGAGLSIPAAQSFSTNDRENTRSGITDKFYSTFIDGANQAGQEWMGRATEYITLNKLQFATWPGFITETDEEENWRDRDEDNDHMNFETAYGLY